MYRTVYIMERKTRSSLLRGWDVSDKDRDVNAAKIH